MALSLEVTLISGKRTILEAQSSWTVEQAGGGAWDLELRDLGAC